MTSPNARSAELGLAGLGHVNNNIGNLQRSPPPPQPTLFEPLAPNPPPPPPKLALTVMVFASVALAQWPAKGFEGKGMGLGKGEAASQDITRRGGGKKDNKGELLESKRGLWREERKAWEGTQTASR